MMNARDRIKRVIDQSYGPFGDGVSERMAASILAALPDMIPDLVWEERRNNYWGHKSHGYQVAWNRGNLWRVRLNGKVICKEIKGHPAAIQWANAHNKAQLAQAMGWTV